MLSALISCASEIEIGSGLVKIEMNETKRSKWKEKNGIELQIEGFMIGRQLPMTNLEDSTL